jgi:hypothetical protein
MTNTMRLLILTLVAAAVTPLHEVRAVMVARWTLDDGTAGLQNLGTDGSGSDLIPAPVEASIAGGPTFTASGGILGGYATFSGNQALVNTIAGNAADDLTGYPFTLSAWIRPTANTARGAAVGMINGAAADQYFSIGTETPAEGSDLQAVRRNTAFTSTEGTATAGTIANGSWHHVAIVNAAPNSSRLYLDGVQVGSSTASVNFSTGVNAIGIGAMRRSAGYIDKFFGDIDDVQIYNDALIASQIQYLFNNVVGPPPPVAACDVDLANGCTLADLQIIADHFFTNVPDRSQGDLNSDGVVNFADYRIWKDTSGSAATLESLGVPEPSAILMMALVLPWLGMRRAMR